MFSVLTLFDTPCGGEVPCSAGMAATSADPGSVTSANELVVGEGHFRTLHLLDYVHKVSLVCSE